MDALTCRSSKQPYSKGQAKRASKRLTRRTGKETWPYACPMCPRWHLTSISPPEQQRRRIGEDED